VVVNKALSLYTEGATKRPKPKRQKMANEERITTGEYATIFELCLHETTKIETKHTPGKNTYNISTPTMTVFRVHGGWIYSRFTGTNGYQEHFVKDTRHQAAQETANRPRQ